MVLYPSPEVGFGLSGRTQQTDSLYSLERAGRSASQAADAQGFWHPCDGGDDTGPRRGDVRLDWRAEGLVCAITLPARGLRKEYPR
jgi:hypothetical protein